MKGRTGKKSQIQKPVHKGDPNIVMDKPMKQGGKVAGKKPHVRADKRARGGSIKIKPENKGKLHKELGVPEGKKIPGAKLEKAKNSSNPAERKRAIFAENAKKFKH